MKRDRHTRESLRGSTKLLLGLFLVLVVAAGVLIVMPDLKPGFEAQAQPPEEQTGERAKSPGEKPQAAGEKPASENPEASEAEVSGEAKAAPPEQPAPESESPREAPPSGETDAKTAPGEGAAPPPSPRSPPAPAARGEPARPAAKQPPGPPGSPPAAAPKTPPEEVQLSFSGVEPPVIIKWLAEMTGKSIYLNKDVKCKLTIMSSKPLPRRDAIRLVYSALGMEGYAAVETRNVIYIVPEAMGAKVSPELIDSEEDGPLEGKQVLVKIFQVKHARATQLKQKVGGVLSEKGKIEVNEQANQLIVTDRADNLQLMKDLLEVLDVTTHAEKTTEIFSLKHNEADDLAGILNAVFSGGSEGGPPSGERPGGPEGQPPSPPGGKKAGGAVRIIADKTTNRLIVTAPPDRLPEIRKLITSLDTEKPADVAVRVIPLEHVSAQELADEVGPMYQKLRGQSLKETIEIAANSRSNSLIVLSSEANFRAIQELISALDTEEAMKKVLRSFPLEHADAEDVAKQLEELYDARSRYRSWYYYERRRGDSEEVRFVANRRRNEVIVIGPASVMEYIEGLIKTLDEPVSEEQLAPRIYPLKFVDAFDVEQVLNELFVRKTQPWRSYWYYDDWEEEEDRDVGRLYGKVRITSELNTNSIIVSSNSVENFAAVESILKQLDVPPETETTVTVELKHANAVNVANNINVLFARSGAPPRRQTQQQPARPGAPQQQNTSNLSASFQLEEEIEEDTYFPWLGGQGEQGRRSRDGRTTRPVSDLVGKVRVVPDTRTNSLIITTNPHFFATVLKVIDSLDIPTPQVMIEAKIIEIGRDDRDRLGIRWSPDGSQVFEVEDLDNSIIGTGSARYTEVFTGSPVADALRAGVLEGSLNLDVLVQFLSKNTDSRLRAEPRINVADNERGQLFVGSRVPFIGQSQLTPQGGRNDSFDYVDVGIILEVTPHINAEGQVSLKVRVESSQIRPGETLFGGAILDTRTYRTDMTVQSGQVLVLGGIIQREESKVVRKIPLLGDIPIIGWYLFSKTDQVQRDVELMVFLRPQVTRSLEDVQKLMETEKKKTPQTQAWEEELEEKARAEEEAKEEEDRD